MANVTRYNPFEDIFGDFTRGFWVKPLAAATESDLKMKIEVEENDKAFTVHADIPGVKKEDIHVDVDRDQVSVRAEVKREKDEKKGDKVVYSERSYGMASRSFTLPVEVDPTATRAEYKDGVLNLTLPKKANGSGKRISIA